jgi:hypothetical protein
LPDVCSPNNESETPHVNREAVARKIGAEQVGLDEVPDGYRAMNERKALKVMLKPHDPKGSYRVCSPRLAQQPQ